MQLSTPVHTLTGASPQPVVFLVNEYRPHFMPWDFRPCCLGAVSSQEVQHLGRLEGRRLWPPMGFSHCHFCLPVPFQPRHPSCPATWWAVLRLQAAHLSLGGREGALWATCCRATGLDSAVPVACAEKAFLCAQLACGGTVADPCKVTGVNGQPRVPV